jgi:hypothetical protein
MSDDLKITIDGAEYNLDFDDFELGELEWLEEELGPLEDANLASARSMVRLVYVLKKRDNPAYTMDEARKLKPGAFGEPELVEEPKKRPTKAAKAAKSTS